MIIVGAVIGVLFGMLVADTVFDGSVPEYTDPRWRWTMRIFFGLAGAALGIFITTPVP